MSTRRRGIALLVGLTVLAATGLTVAEQEYVDYIETFEPGVIYRVGDESSGAPDLVPEGNVAGTTPHAGGTGVVATCTQWILTILVVGAGAVAIMLIIRKTQDREGRRSTRRRVDPSRLQSLLERPEELARLWQGVGSLSRECLQYWQLLDRLPQLVELEDGIPVDVDVETEVERIEEHCDAARDRVLDELELGLSVADSCQVETPHPRFLMASALFIRGMQLCHERDMCCGNETCPVAALTEEVSIEV